jgi:hypothetical protein
LAHTHTSDLLDELLSQAPDGPVDLEWLLTHLDRRSFGLILLLLGLLMIIPGVATIATVMIVFPSIEMLLGRSGPTFPHFLSKRPFDFKRFSRFITSVKPVLLALENASRPRWNAHRHMTGRLVGAVVLLLALSAMWPLPLVSVIPGIVISAIAIGYLQEDGLVLVAALTAATFSLLGFAWTVRTSADAIMKWIGIG